MPHKCLDCKNLVESGTIDLQKGCPLCGGKKFQYIRPRPQPDEKPTVAEYVAQAELREPQMEAKESPVSRVPGRKHRGASKEPSPGEARPESTQEIKPDYRSEYKTDYQTRFRLERKPAEQKPEQKSEYRPAAKDKPAPHDKGKEWERIETITIVENGTYDINLPLLLSRKELVMSREEGNYVVDLNSAMKPEKKPEKKPLRHKK